MYKKYLYILDYNYYFIFLKNQNFSSNFSTKIEKSFWTIIKWQIER